MMLASMLGAPVILFFGVHLGGRRYEVRFEPFADRLAIGRGTRTADLTRLGPALRSPSRRDLPRAPLQLVQFLRFLGWPG